VRFIAVDGPRGEGLVEIAIERSPALEAAGSPIELGGVRLRRPEPV